jgi:anti-sigma factor RsiW
LAHVGQPLAFKTEPGAGPAIEDTGEHEALEQELVVQRLAERGRAEPRMAPPEVRRLAGPQAPQPAAPVILGESMVSGGIGSPNLVFQQARLAESGGVEVQRTLVPGTGGELLQRVPISEETPAQIQPVTPQAAQAAPDIKELARKVYTLLKERLRAEHDRHGFYR